jgi:flagellar basal-body rod protein FlgF
MGASLQPDASMQNRTDIALSRMTAQMRVLDVIANKTERVLFSDWLSRQQGTDAPRGGSPIAYTQDRATYREQQQGTLTHTGNPLDLAIGGDGYFSVSTAQGVRLTRAGNFTIGADGTVQDMSGNPLLDINGQAIHLAADDMGLTVAGAGTISSVNGQIDKIGIVTPSDPNQLQGEGGRLALSNSPTSPVASPHLIQGAVEQSNVQPVLELTHMLDEERQFQPVSQFLQTESDRQQSAIDKLTQQSS